MTARNGGILLMVFVAACGGHRSAPEDGSVKRDAVGGDSPVATMTSVKGMLEGAPFELRYSVAAWPPEGDPRIWVCATDVPVTVTDCQSSTGPTRVMFFGPFVYSQAGSPRWDLAELGLYRVGNNPVTAYAHSGTIQVTEDDASSGSLTLLLSVDFGETQPTAGAVVIP